MEATKEYVKRFNQAYILAKHRPQLIVQIVQTSSENDYIKGMKDGKRTYEQERMQARTQELKNRDPQKSQNQDLER